MPIYESICTDDKCFSAGWKQEHYYPRFDSEMQPCGRCGGPTERVQSNFRVVFTGPLTARYNDKNADNPHQDGHWAWRRKSSLSGKPEPVFIDSFDAQRDFCKAEGVVNPKEMPRNYQISDTGKGELNTRGLPGTEL